MGINSKWEGGTFIEGVENILKLTYGGGCTTWQN